DKWARGRRLADELRDRLAPGGVILHRMGKQYPGESLPRWALDIIARRDGLALWPARALGDDGSVAAARRFGEGRGGAPGVDGERQAAYGAPWELLRAEASLPVDVDPRTAGLDDPEERKRLAGILDRGASSVVGWVLPLARTEDGWRTERWRLRRQ